MAPKSKIKNNVPAVVRKIDKDLLEIQKTIGSATADLVNFAFLDIQKKSFVDGKGQTKKKNGFEYYEQIAGGNRASRKRPNVQAFHKSKIVNRSDKITPAFQQLSFKVFKGFTKKLAVGTNSGGAKVTIERQGPREKPTAQVVQVRFEGRIGQILNWFHFGQGGGKERVQIKNSKGKIQNAKKAQRAIVFNGLKRSMKRWNKYVEYKLTGTIKKRNRKKAK